jgi:RNA polymerase sigma-70 factor (ECF subfamily)
MADKKSFADDAMQFAPQLLGAATRMTRNRSDAEDLVQETMLKAFKSYESFDEGTTFAINLIDNYCAVKCKAG